VKDLLASNGFILVFCHCFSLVPAAIHEIESSEGNLYDDEVDGLIANEGEYCPSQLVMVEEICRRDKQVDDEMEDDSGDNDEHGPIGVSIGIPHLRKLIHESAKGQGKEYNEDKDNVGQNSLEGLHNWPDVNYIHKEVKEANEEGDDEEEVENREDLQLKSLLLNYAYVFPKYLFGLWSWFAVHPELLLVMIAEEHLDDLPL
jgi:hypothetical protein